ncbi:MAG: undecaprenyldiphospho-muramoylpentapeptide beta-N-acetylglucosaminyltransferase [Coriobacteriia bacterium]|nr:undecaprenyldiphospho-muramoylpentapeptide beta-N-acetylglucosaminyltransferase [Coriobacteriia bacterium]
MKIAIAAGGTAGHINPAISLAQELALRGHSIEFIGTPQGLEAKLVREAGFDFFPVESSGFDRSKPQSLFIAAQKLFKGTRILKAHFKNDMPDVFIGFGAYLELAAARAAKALKIPVMIHEQNSVPGLANKMVSRYAQVIALSYPITKTFIKKHASHKARIIVTGNPVRASILAGDKKRGRARYGIPEDALMLLVFGGSLGARHINESFAVLKDELLALDKLYVVHSVGKHDLKEAHERFNLSEEEKKRYIIREYIEDMGDSLKAADLVVSRAGASSLAEISALAVPSILIPYPFATQDHQAKNAQALLDVGAAYLFRDTELDSEAFKVKLFELLTDEQGREKLRAGAQKLASEGSAAKLASAVESLGRMH